jgi:hypothetical protein
MKMASGEYENSLRRLRDAAVVNCLEELSAMFDPNTTLEDNG